MLSHRILQSSGCETPLEPKLIPITVASGIVQVPRLKVPLFSALGRSEISYAIIALDLPSSAGVDGLLGIDFLSLCRAMIDIKRCQITIEE